VVVIQFRATSACRGGSRISS